MLKKTLITTALIGLLVLSSVGTVGAVTYVQMPDEALYEQADVIAEVTILQQLPGLAGNPPVTEYYAVAKNVIKGDVLGQPYPIQGTYASSDNKVRKNLVLN